MSEKNSKVTKLHDDEQNKRLVGKDFDKKMVDMLMKGRDDLDKIKKERAALTAKKNEVIARWSAKGLSPDAIIDAANYCQRSEEDKINYDISYTFAREVFGEPMQIDIFEESLASEIRERMATK